MRSAVSLFVLGGLLVGACTDDATDLAGPAEPRMYHQVQRLGNPLVSGVFLAKRSHAQHGAIGPAQDVPMIGTELQQFVLTVGGRSQTVATTLAAVLLPDMLIVQTSKPSNTTGWLSWALADGWGGRRLQDDVVDAGLMAIFGPLLDSQNVSPGLSTDNVGSDSQFLPQFPYLGQPN